jgi:putative addiction module killer protein
MPVALTVVEYVREDSSNLHRTWFDGLDPEAPAKVATATLRLEMGNTSSVRWIGTIGEYRIDWGPGYRIYLARDGNTVIVLFVDGTIRRQQGDIRRAEALFAEYKARKAAVATPKGRR